ncbi:UDP-3-O-(3-hydroxymyristoyl)glucosamine N-acyltransferase [Candidatus Bealeia paramacronuclearis]|uniref:UDP-3-O-acylglucosamine N-acyltransferase n=1 Tax=Candidatus Bealeia paramacronuclearis TaxID=1921001 RepID=A0ABZ2C6Y8_9PROT|nr:UDP-3-O-(3-hydroxymyristoyl)glucosamine N-acyltransferase [Candidatus Bealeia paramacronuclearis]
MADSKFFSNKGPFTLEDLARIGECEIHRGDVTLSITDVAPMDAASSGTISVLNNPKYVSVLKTTNASACIVAEEYVEEAPPSMPLLVSEAPYRSYALIANAFYPNTAIQAEIHPSAVIHPSVKIGSNCNIAPLAVLEEGVELGNGITIGTHTFIGRGVSIGDGSIIASHVSIEYALIGRGVHIKTGARIGQQGYGFFMDDTGHKGGHVPVPQLGRVIIQDHVEIGANTTVDRGSGHDTVIGYGTRIDNLVQIAHNVQTGKGCVIVAQTGISGSTKLGDFVAMGGQVGMINHLKIGSGARIAAQSGVMRDIEPGEVVGGTPAMPIKSFYRQLATLQRLTKEKAKRG